MYPTFSYLSNYIGIFGVILTLIAYYLLNINRLSSNNLTYLLLNFFGSWLILFSLIFHWNLSSVVIEIAWISISVIGLYRFIKSVK
jgi:hypothetical protein